MISEFTYTSTKGTLVRKVAVFKEDNLYIEGLDLTILPKEVSDIIINRFKDYKPTSESVKIEGWDSSWNKAWRRFSKSKINN